MKSLFNRLRHKNDTTSTSRPSSSTSQRRYADSSYQSTSSTGSMGESSFRPTTPIHSLHSRPSSSTSVSTQPPSIAEEHVDDASIPEEEADDTIRIRNFSGPEFGAKKVTFRSPMPTPVASVVLDETPVIQESPRIASRSPTKRAPIAPPRPPSAQSRTYSRQSLPSLSYPRRQPSLTHSSRAHSPTKSAMSPTPSEQSFSRASTQSYIPPPNSWSEMAEDDLIQNLSPRERTRQEVLWEIVSSEERYVAELVKLNETFARALLPPSATLRSLNLFDSSQTLTHTLSRTMSPAASSFSTHSPASPTESFDFLPIAAQYSSTASAATNARMNAYNALTNGRPSEGPNRQGFTIDQSAAQARSHQSLPPPRRDGGSGGSQPHSSSRMSFHPGSKSGKDRRMASGNSISSVKSVEVPLPEDFEKVLTALAGGILEGHIKLATALRKRYEDQYPLVRSLADVFTSHSYILREYATYVLHLEKALEQVDSALAACTASMPKRASRRLEETDMGKFGKRLLELEELAAERGESGLAISLSKPFQRLLKYPLLFQNLLFNTDPSLREYEATLAMVDEVEDIVRTIEDEKASMEEREKTRDVWARIDGLEKDRLLMAPKPGRLLVSEAQINVSEAESKAIREASMRQKKSLRRWSDIIKGSESTDLWIVRFSDVSLLCERTGLTSLPVSNFKRNSKSDSADVGRSKYATMGRRAGSIKARNLYKFVKVHEWNLKQNTGSTEGLLSMEEISRVRSAASASPEKVTAKIPAPAPEAAPEATPEAETVAASEPEAKTGQPTIVPLKGDGGAAPRRATGDFDTLSSDKLSVMSFAFKSGSDQIKPVARKTRPTIAPPNNTAARAASAAGQRRASGGHLTGNAADAKFAHRLRNIDGDANSGHPTIRPSSRTRRSLPPAMTGTSINGQRQGGARALNGRASPALSPTDGNMRPPPVPPKSPKKARPASLAPSINGSVRGVTGVKGSGPGAGAGAGSGGGVRAGAGSAAAVLKNGVNGGKRVVPKASAASVGAGRGAIRPSPSTDSGVAGMWTAYRDGGAVGTPRKPPPSGRQLGGRI